jgi:hypothetical protein
VAVAARPRTVPGDIFDGPRDPRAEQRLNSIFSFFDPADCVHKWHELETSDGRTYGCSICGANDTRYT